MSTPKTRVYFELTDRQVALLSDLVAITDAGSRRELVVSALNLLRWAAREVVEGRRIIAVDGDASREIVLPLLEGLRRTP